MSVVWLLGALLVPGPAHTGKMDLRKGLKRGPSANAGEIPALAELLRRTGWLPTVSTYTSAEVVTGSSTGSGRMRARPRSAPR